MGTRMDYQPLRVCGTTNKFRGKKAFSLPCCPPNSTFTLQLLWISPFILKSNTLSAHTECSVSCATPLSWVKSMKTCEWYLQNLLTSECFEEKIAGRFHWCWWWWWRTSFLPSLCVGSVALSETQRTTKSTWICVVALPNIRWESRKPNCVV